MKRFIGLLTAVSLMFLCATPVLATGLGISPPSVEFDVLANGSTKVEFLVYDFTGDLEISLEDIPLRVEPTIVPVTATEGGTRVVLTFYGDESLGSEIYEGKIRFLAMTGGTVAMGIKVRATVNHIATGQPEEVVSGPEESPPEQSSLTPSSSFPVIPVAGIAAGTIIIITLIIVIARRSRY
ncbi:hypothetical protein ES703_42476 [subsurface metagenome]